VITIVEERPQLEFIVQRHDPLHVLWRLLRHPNIEIYSLDEAKGIKLRSRPG
jgi:hypothetical protein